MWLSGQTSSPSSCQNRRMGNGYLTLSYTELALARFAKCAPGAVRAAGGASSKSSDLSLGCEFILGSELREFCEERAAGSSSGPHSAPGSLSGMDGSRREGSGKSGVLARVCAIGSVC